MASVGQMRGVNNSNTMEHTHMLAHTLAQNNDPKFQVYIRHLDLRFPYDVLVFNGFQLDEHGLL